MLEIRDCLASLSFSGTGELLASESECQGSTADEPDDVGSLEQVEELLHYQFLPQYSCYGQSVGLGNCLVKIWMTITPNEMMSSFTV